ncbi:hypothetical protein PLICRDRAFT_117723 [Plicaturopsis crispa FD-325 SS-3]|uniref:Acetyl-CoA synthetase-like protein n=1 Tax=Plicaturopsis crispa FD-325 SS-3 TaxID=944288 RepID=A0A0C9SKY7_PLICR|nr:hypothetical protein PLICRDRAFT_117723 [Plicaturopsis crispa FD-325 SS-3]
MSPRNSPAAVVSMLQRTGCRELIVTPSVQALVDGVKAEIASDTDPFELLIREIPPLSAIYPKLGAERVEDPFLKYPSSKDFPKLTDVAYYIHSSGSTGHPKPIATTHEMFMLFSEFAFYWDTIKYDPPLRMGAMSLPPFHAFGMNMQLFIPLWTLSSVAVFPPTSENDPRAAPMIPTSDNILEHMKRTQCNATIMVPSFVEIWEQSAEAVEYLKTLQFLGYGGGPLPAAKGDSLVKAGVKLRTVYGGTEFGAPTLLVARDDDEWNWMRFSDRVNIQWADQHDGTYELQFLNGPTHKVAVENIPGGYATSDLFEKHQTKEGLFRIVGRVDDVITLASGEKTVPGPMEAVIRSSPLVEEAVMFGREHNQVGVIVEPHNYEVDPADEKQLAEFRNKIWPAVERANADAPAFSRIFKEMILVARPEKPILRTPKGTVSRKRTIKDYEPEIQALYETVEATSVATDAVAPPPTWSVDNIERFLADHAKDIHDGKNFSLDADLFEQGFDSLSATFLRNRIISALRWSKDRAAGAAVSHISQNIVFANPTLRLLASHIASLVAQPQNGHAQNGHAANGHAQNGHVTVNEKAKIENMIEQYSTGLLPLKQTINSPSTTHVVLLTGSTGGLGSQLLAFLLTRPNVRRVYAFNRPRKGSALLRRQITAFEERGFDVGLLDSEKLRLVESDTSQERLGLLDEEYDELLSSVTAIIHNAWRLDFNLSLSSFEPNIRGTRNLIDFALASPHTSSIRFVFTSSVGSTQSWDRSRGPYPEEVQYDASYAIGSGYGEAKYVVERILVKTGLQATSVRIGQITGSHPNGAWATSDWVPIFVKSSLSLGALPDAQGLASWIPLRAVAEAILDITFSESTPPPALNLVHPRPVEWHFIINAIGQALSKELDVATLPLVPFEQWFATLTTRADNATEKDIQQVPAIKLLEFFRTMSAADSAARTSGRHDVEAGGITPLATEKIQQVSPTMATLKPIEASEAQSWVKYWVAKEFF